MLFVLILIVGLKRSGKSCRLRWMNYLTPDVKRGDFSEEEEDLVLRLHSLLGNRLFLIIRPVFARIKCCFDGIYEGFLLLRWSLIAGRIPGRTDNQVKNFWNTHLSKKIGVDNKKRRRGCVRAKYVPRAEAEGNCNTGEGDKLVDESWSDDLMELASMHEAIMRDDFGCTFSFPNAVFDLCTDSFHHSFFGL